MTATTVPDRDYPRLLVTGGACQLLGNSLEGVGAQLNSFGQFFATRDPRQIQFGLKFYF